MSRDRNDLEVLSDGDGPDPVPGRRPAPRGRRWVAVAVVVAVAAGWLAFPARSSLIRSELRRLEGQWIASQVLGAGRQAVVNRLDVTASAEDDGRVRAALIALYAEQGGRLRAARSRIHGYLLVDPRLSRLRTVLDHALASQTADVDAAGRAVAADPVLTLPPPDASPATVAATMAADALLAADLHRLALAPRLRPDPPLFHAADATLAVLGRITDHPERSRLVVGTGDGFALVDLGANRITAAHLSGFPIGFVAALAFARRDYVVLVDAAGLGEFVAAPVDLQGVVRPIGGPFGTIAAVPAVDPEGTWLETNDGTVREVDGSGRLLGGPFTLPTGSVLQGAVGSALVLVTPLDPGQDRFSPLAITVVDAVTGAVRRVLTRAASAVVAVGGDTVVWIGRGLPSAAFAVVTAGTAHLTSVSTGADRVVAGPLGRVPCSPQWSISADGTRVASAWCATSSLGDVSYAPGVIDLSTGRVDLAHVVTTGDAPLQVNWATGDDAMFLTGPGPNMVISPTDFRSSGLEVLSYAPGAGVIDHLRLRHLAVNAIAVLPPAS